MTIVRFASVVSLALFVLLVPRAAARDLATIQKSGVLRGAVDGETPGFNFYKGKQLLGLDVELAEQMAKSLGLKMEWTAAPFNTLLVALGQDRFDVIVTAHAMTPERQKVADFVNPHYCTGVALAAKPGGPKTKEQLKGKTVAVPVGTVYYDYLKTVPGIGNVKTFPSETAALQDLLSGKSDAWASDELVVREALKTQRQLEMGPILFPQKNAMVVAKGNTTLLKALNEQLAKAQKDGTFKTLSERYFQRDIRCQ